MFIRQLLDTQNANRLEEQYVRDELPHAGEPFSREKDNQNLLQDAKKRFEQDWKNKPIPHGQISDYQKCQILAQGKLNTVILAKHKKSSNKRALKCFDKYTLIHSNLLDKVHHEMKLMLAVSFPFVMSLDCVMQDNTTLYLSMPFIECGDLSMHIRKLGSLEELHAKFYAAQVCLGLEYLHTVNIVHRDVKPENVLVDFLGKLKITDMGCSKIIESRTCSFCGTPDYIAPEIIKTQPYAASVDWWSFGVMLYEMCYGKPPFKDNDTYKLYDKIISGKYSMPSLMSNELQDLITNLLQVDVTKRYGCLRRGVMDIKDHPWFQIVNWESLINGKSNITYAPYCLGIALLKGAKLAPITNKNTSVPQQYHHLFDRF